MKIWFQNRRTKWKKVDHISNEEAAKIMKSKLGGGRRSRSTGQEDGRKVTVCDMLAQEVTVFFSVGYFRQDCRRGRKN